ncbi:hypothetical protein [Mucilaginibacter humi]|nr:hypothetical protein [Mucilaginibacter humi]
MLILNLTAPRWPSEVTLSQFKAITKLNVVKDTILKIYANEL